jgi:hypothetical protein
MIHRPVSLLVVLLCGAAAAQGEVIGDRWYVVSMQGKKAGWFHERIEGDEKRVVSRSEMRYSIKRGAQGIELSTEQEFIETPEGKPISATLRQVFSKTAMEKRITFEAAGITVVTTQGEQNQTQKFDVAKEPWLAPAAAGRYVEARMKAGDKKVQFRTMDPSMGMEPFVNTIEVIGPRDIDVYGKRVPAIENIVSMSNMPGIKQHVDTDEAGTMLRTTIQMGAMSMELLAVDRELATAKSDAPEMLIETLVKPSFALRKPREMKRAEFHVSVGEGELPELPSGGSQRFERIDQRNGRVTIDTAAAVKETGPEPKVVNTPLIDGADPKVIELAQQATKGMAADQGARAEAMRRFVHHYITMADLSVGMGSAGETARTRVGDCTEHAVLLAAMLSADGIPSRAATGLIYVDQFVGRSHVFGYHMWAEAWIDGKWIDLDATLDDGTPFDATHIRLSASNMGDGAMANDIATSAPLIGTLRIDMENKPGHD